MTGLIEGFTEEIGRSVIRDVATAIADGLIAKGLIQAADKDNCVGSINFLGDVALTAYLDGKM